MTRNMADAKNFFSFELLGVFYPGSIGTVPDYSLMKWGVILLPLTYPFEVSKLVGD